MGYKNPEDKKRAAHEDYIKNRARHREQGKRWYLANRERILQEQKERKTAFRALHPIVRKTEEEKKAKRKLWIEGNRQKLKALGKKYRTKNLKKYQLYARDYYATKLSPHIQFQRLKQEARKRGYEVCISFEEFSEIVVAPCNYCGEASLRRGIDRVDNSKGYSKENCAPCCKICNYMKKTFSILEFLIHIKKIAAHNVTYEQQI